MNRIFKYVMDSDYKVNMPVGAVIRHIGLQNEQYTVWAEIDDSNLQELETREFVVVGTGWEIPFHSAYFTTIMDGAFVWHVYEVYP
jgi:hypothetical protein